MSEQEKLTGKEQQGQEQHGQEQEQEPDAAELADKLELLKKEGPE